MSKTRPFWIALVVVSLFLILGSPSLPAQNKGQGEKPAAEAPEKKKKSVWDFLRGRTNGEEKKEPEKKTEAEPQQEAAQGAEAETDELAEREARKAEKEMTKLERAAEATGSPEQLHAVQARLKASVVARDPNGRAYLDLVDSGAATAAHLNEFAIYLAQRGMVREALEYQKEALRISPDDPDLWINLGTLHRETRNDSGAMAAFRRAISLDPNHALAHYNLGVSYDARSDYEHAIEEYRIALTLDPNLADPEKNPQIINNDRLLAVNLLLYQQKAGALGLPLISKPEGRARP